MAKKLDIQPFVGVSDEKGLQLVYAKNRQLIKETKEQYYEIDVAEAMEKLATCGQLIQLAYAATNRFPCQAEVVKLLSKYGTLVKNSYIASTKFVVASIGSLNYHKIALKILEKKPEKAITFICKCSNLAGEMATVAKNLTGQAEELTQIAENALVIAVKDQSLTDQQKKAMEKKLAEAKALSAQLEAQTKEMNSALQDLKQKEAAAIKEAKTERDRNFALNMVKAIVAPVTEVLTFGQGGKGGGGKGKGAKGGDDSKDNDEQKQAGKTADDRAYELSRQRYEMQSKLIEENAKLAKTVSELGHFKDSKNTLEQALISIEIAIKTLGKIKVIFSNTQLFWEGVQENCKALMKVGENILEFADDTDIFMDEIKEEITKSAINWFTLCVVNYDAKQAIKTVDATVDNILSDLPTRDEALQLVDTLSVEMAQSLKDENKKLTAANKEIKAIKG